MKVKELIQLLNDLNANEAEVFFTEPYDEGDDLMITDGFSVCKGNEIVVYLES